ncbi:DUF1737 domain-containing protein [Bosea sp. CCNWLW174]|uniref:DUF1737 domain-containing protein n=1 Tax=unclassified Bosea (in: a-proteobacteria) TaxID=2653178 RepID=UPI00301559C8
MPKQTTLYRYLTGPDDASFCHRVSDALSRGWVLYGHPTLTYDEKSGRVICAQAIIKDVDRAYEPGLDLSKE